ncbi:DMT family transporter [Desertibaculum subflavum]|uniref:DMT family transporter n=1 Tax=Desertibaculum subflavum TaxID=2268458 RepID=UPI0034D279C1
MSQRLAVAAAAASGVLVGSAMVATRYVVDQTGPGSLALMRYAIGFLCLAPAMLATGQAMRFARADVVPIAILGITQFGILIALLNFGLRFIPSARGALIFAAMPLITMLIGAALGREPLTAPKTIGVALTILGVGVTLGEKALAPGAGVWWGELAVLGSAICGALCSVLYRPYLQRYPTIAVSSFAMLASVGFLAVVAAGEGFFAAWPAITAPGWGAVIFIGLNSGVGYFLWLYALRHASPTRVTVFLSLSPVTASFLGALLLSEAVTGASLAGLAAVVIGIWIAHR